MATDNLEGLPPADLQARRLIRREMNLTVGGRRNHQPEVNAHSNMRSCKCLLLMVLILLQRKWIIFMYSNNLNIINTFYGKMWPLIMHREYQMIP